VSVYTTRGQPYGGGVQGGVGALEPKGLAARLAGYKRAVAKRYRVVDPDQIADKIPEGDLHISTKVDGELWFLCKQGGEVALCSPTGRVLEGIAVVNEAAEKIAGCPDLIAVGELFAVSKDGRTRVKDVVSALGDPSRAPTLGLKVFDLVAEGDTDWLSLPYSERWARIEVLFSGGRRIAPVLSVQGQTDAVHQRYDEWVNSGKFEGLVVRGDQGGVFKVKPTVEVDAVVIGFGERRTGELTEVREPVLGFLRDDGRWQVTGTVGGGLSDVDRLAWHRRLEPMVVPSAFRLANNEGTLCRFVRPEIVVEVRISDVMDTDGRDMPIRRMALDWDGAEWRPSGLEDFVSLVFPVLVRERPDKPLDVGHVGEAQVWSLLPPPEVCTPPEGPHHAASRLYRRVWTKEAKGQTAVRKVVAVQTNKAADPDWPPFVAWFTDWSAGRKVPLETNLRVASTREKLDEAVEAWIVENVKKGWVETT